MAIQKTYDTVTDAVSDLSKRGYTKDFSLLTEKNCLVCESPFTELSPDQFHIDEVHRFEGPTDPGDEMIIYAISSNDGEIKGVVVNAFGIYSSYRASKLVDHLNAHVK